MQGLIFTPLRSILKRMFLEGDRILVARCIEGEEDAWRELDRRFRSQVLAVVRRTLSDAGGPSDGAAVEEAVSRFFWDLCVADFRRLRQWKGKCALSSWMALIARTSTLRYLRGVRSGTERLRDRRTELAELPSTGKDILSAQDLQDRASLWRQAFQSLTPQERQWVRRVYEEGESLEAVARSLRIPRSTLQFRLKQALERLGRFFRSSLLLF